MSDKLDVKTIRELVKQLSSTDIAPKNYIFPVKPVLTVDGVVLMGSGMMHPDAFKNVFGEEAYQELLKQPRVLNPYGDDIDS